MSYTPTIPLAGVAGWRFLERTQEKQQTAFEGSAEVKREIAYFQEKIGTITSAADLVADRRLLNVALTAFGLEGDLDKKAFIRQVLDSDLNDTKSLASRLTNDSYYKLAQTFGFTGSPPATAGVGFAAKIIEPYKDRAFEGAVGAVNNNVRLVMNFKREIASLAAGKGGSWYSIIGSKPLREVMLKAFGLPASFSNIDVDKQRDMLMDKMSSMFGTSSLTGFQDPAAVEKVITRFLARTQVEEGVTGYSPAASALSLLQSSSARGSSGLMNLLASRH